MLRTEADVVRTLEQGTYTLDQLYRLCHEHADIERDQGFDAPSPQHRTDQRWRHRVRCVLQSLRAAGSAHRIRRATWLLHGTLDAPRRLLLVVAGGSPAAFELQLADAIDLLRDLEEPADLVLCDPPYGLRRDDPAEAARFYRRDPGATVGGYRDVQPERYDDFTRRWVQAAARVLRPGGQLVVVTGPQQAATVQYHGQQAGLTWVTSIAAFRTFGVRATRQPTISHWTVSAMCRGRRDHPRRVFNPPPDLPKAMSGVEYPLDWWPENGRVARRGLLRYDNQLPDRLVLRIVGAFSDRGEMVADPFTGATTIGEACLRLGRRFVGSDTNPEALRFSAARLLDEHLWPEQRAPRLIPAS